MSLELELRPKTLDEVWGNQETIRTLQNTFKKEDHKRTFLFYGDRGCGKTTTARACVPEIGLAEVVEYNIAQQRNIDDARSILQGLDYMPAFGKRVYIFDECHKANDFWSDAMLKALEEPPEWAYFFLCSSEPGKLKGTIKSRCQKFKFSPLPLKVIAKHMGDLFHGDNPIKGRLSTEHRDMIVEQGAGIPRETLELLDKVLTADIQDRDAILQVEAVVPYENLGKALLNGDLHGALRAIEADKGRGGESIRKGVIGYMSAVMLDAGKRNDTKAVGKAYKIFYSFKEPFFNTGWPGLVYAVVDSIYGG